MFRNSSSSTRRIRTVHVVAAGAVVLAMSGSAAAGMVITGKQIKDNSVTGKDIKNGSLLIKDLKSTEVAKLRGTNGLNGLNGSTGATGATGGAGTAGATGATGATGAPGAVGAPGASAFAPPPSGAVIKGGGILNVEVDTAGVAMRSYAPLPFTTTTPLVDFDASRNLWFGSNATSLGTSEINTVACPGTATAPDPTAGTMCVYIAAVSNIATATGALVAGTSGGSDAAESNGFYVIANSNAAGPMTFRYVWAYKAP